MYQKIRNNSQIQSSLRSFFKNKKAGILEVDIDKGVNIVPRVQLNGSLDDMFPSVKDKNY